MRAAFVIVVLTLALLGVGILTGFATYDQVRWATNGLWNLLHL
jgi:hypothetical protein